MQNAELSMCTGIYLVHQIIRTAQLEISRVHQMKRTAQFEISVICNL
jgi:hypothetical protein